jgi:hypothetical protein
MAELKNDPDIERLAAAVVGRFEASERSARLVVGGVPVNTAPTLMDRLASAVGQRLAARSAIPSIDRLASALAHRLAASPTAARLASAVTRHFAKTTTEVDIVAESVAKRLQPGR